MKLQAVSTNSKSSKQTATPCTTLAQADMCSKNVSGGHPVVLGETQHQQAGSVLCSSRSHVGEGALDKQLAIP